MVFEHERDDPLVAAVFIEGLQHVEHDHVRPEVWLSVEAGSERTRAEPAIRFLAGKHRINPFAGFRDDAFVLEHIPKIAKALQPIRQLFPAAVALAICSRPRIAFELAPLGNLRQPSRHAAGFEFKLVAQPTLGCDRADGQLDECARYKRRPVGDIKRLSLAVAFHHRGGRDHSRCS